MKRNIASREVVIGKTYLYIYTLKILATEEAPTFDYQRSAFATRPSAFASTSPGSLTSNNTDPVCYE